MSEIVNRLEYNTFLGFLSYQTQTRPDQTAGSQFFDAVRVW